MNDLRQSLQEKNFKQINLDKAEFIIQKTSRWFGKEKNDVILNRRYQENAFVRRLCIYFIRKFTNLSLKETGSLFEGRHHTTIMWSLGQLENEFKNDFQFRVIFKELYQFFLLKFAQLSEDKEQEVKARAMQRFPMSQARIYTLEKFFEDFERAWHDHKQIIYHRAKSKMVV